jgi:hypothetical protein
MVRCLAQDASGNKDSCFFRVTVNPLTLAPPVLFGWTGVPNAPRFRWSSSAGAAYYWLQLSLDSLFSSLFLSYPGLVDTEKNAGPLTPGGRFYARVAASDTSRLSLWSNRLAVDVPIGPTTDTFQLNAGWNLVSLPKLVSDARVSVLFPGSDSRLFEYQNSYILRDTLRKGRGYWIKFSAAQPAAITGMPILAETVAVSAGWNLIGSLSTPFPVAWIRSVPPTMALSNLFGYEGSYAIDDTLRPSKGYWIKAGEPGTLILSVLEHLSTPRTAVLLTDTPPPAPASARIEVPTEYRLAQNFPNPFNPSTTISYDLPLETDVRLEILTPLGQLVERLVDRSELPGLHQITWEAANHPSGVYFLKLSAGQFVEVRKMVIAK